MKTVFCGVPALACKGSTVLANSMAKHIVQKSHGDSEQAFRCYKGWLISRGYKQIGGREFTLSDGPILVLSKKSKFGTRMRMGKSEGGKGSTRFLPDSGHGFIHSI